MKMERLERKLGNQMAEVPLSGAKTTVSQWFQRLTVRLSHLLFQQGFLFLIIGFLLGRALILTKMTPFALPFFSAIYLLRRDKLGFVFIALFAGSLTISFYTSLFIVASIGMFLVFYRLFYWIDAPSKRLPVVVFFASIFAKMGMIYTWNREWTIYEGMTMVIEAGLASILTLIFLQSVPLFDHRKYKQTLKPEEVISFVILISSMLTGMVGWSIYDLSLEHIASRYLLLLFAFVAGATVGSTVGVVTGLILSLANVSNLYQMSLLAFAGLLGGLLKEGRKLGVSFGLIVATLLISLYSQGIAHIIPNVVESLFAVLLFFMTPQSLTSKMAKYVPGTVEHTNEQQQYVRKIRDVTAQRVEQFSHVFQALSKSFSSYGVLTHEEEEEREIDYFLSDVAAKTCQTCFKKDQCWITHFDKTYDYMKKIMQEASENDQMTNAKLLREWNKQCVKANKVVQIIEKDVSFYKANKKLKQQMKESRRLVAEQLLGVSQVMEDFAKEIQKERENYYVQEEQILHALQQFGVDVNDVEIYSLDKGSVDIEMVIPYCDGRGECEKLIAPMLSDILGETIIVKKEDCSIYPNGDCRVAFSSSKAFVIDTGVAYVAKGGGFISGDSYGMMEIGGGKYALAISDGMGNGERAHYESKETLKLLQKILQSGIEERIAIKSINSILALRTTEEIFSTLDLAIVDLQNATTKFLKVGSSPSFIKRGNHVMKIESSNLPIGIITGVEFEMIEEQLKAGDLLIMMSDGVFDGVSHIENHDVWMKRKIKELKTNDPQEVSELLLEEVIRVNGGEIEDDMTIVVARIKHNTPKWAVIPAYQYMK